MTFRFKPWRLIGWSIPLLILLLPLVAMQFTEEVDWQLADFVLMGSLMAFVGGGIELACRSSNDIRYRAAASLALLAGFLITWVNLAVGILGADGSLPLDVLYFVVLLTGLLAGALRRFRAQSMVRILYSMIAGLVLIAVIALATDSLPEYSSPKDIIGITGFFSTLLLIPALLFRQAAGANRRAGLSEP